MNLGFDAPTPLTGAEQMFDNSAMSSNRRIEGLNEAKKEVVRLFALTEKLVTEAGMSHADLQP